MTSFLEPYNPVWQTEFEELKLFLAAQLEGLQTNIEHVGSTAIPGLIAKPILDIDIVITDQKLLGDVSARLEELGYGNKGEQGITGRFTFRQTSELTPCTTTTSRTWQTHHLYLCFSDSLALKNHLLFRDALKGNRHIAEQYGQLKKTLFTGPGITREEYAKHKTEFILKILAGVGLETKELDQIRRANV